jgi:hypothetical protein
MRSALHANHPFRIFFISGFISIASLVAVWYYLGPQAAFITLVLMMVEITFSFDNAIINAKVLARMSDFWQQMFMTVGILIAVFGMRLVFPIVLVMITTGLGAGAVTNLALNHPEQYSAQLDKAHPLISSFGGMFLLMLCLNFFFDAGRKVNWISVIERPMQRLGAWWVYTFVCFGVLALCAAIPLNKHPEDTLVAGIIGIISYLVISNLAIAFGKTQEDAERPGKEIVKQAGMAGFIAFIYLQVLDATFSFDGVIGAFAVTQDVVLIAIGLGIGALWVRSLTLFMVKRQVLHAYRYLEHGAHYTIGILAFFLLGGLFVHIPEVIAGLSGIAIVTASVLSSISAARADKKAHHVPVAG